MLATSSRSGRMVASAGAVSQEDQLTLPHQGIGRRLARAGASRARHPAEGIRRRGQACAVRPGGDVAAAPGHRTMAALDGVDD